MDHFL
jgi:hypothetical protein